MSWALLIGLILALAIALAAAWSRRAELERMQELVRVSVETASSTRGAGLLQQPLVDLSRCLGCGTCVRACPEGDVLALVHGQALVVNGARCVGHAACERECPVGAITVTLANLAERRDVPVLSPELEAHGAPNLFLAGEVTAHALIKTAVEQGTRVAAEVARRVQAASVRSGVRSAPAPDARVLDLCIVGAGPAGLACALEAKRSDLAFTLLDQEPTLGGTVAKYPRRKLVLTQPVALPLVGGMDRSEYSKEELIELWQRIAQQAALPIRGGETFERLERGADGTYVVHTDRGEQRARHVCLALGRRGTPRRLGVPGEDLAKVAYSLLDARSYRERRVAVVGGGDSAVEAALALAEQPGNRVTLIHRRADFPRLRARNSARLAQATATGRVTLATRTRVVGIEAESLSLQVDDVETVRTLPNDDVFVLAGGAASLPLLERAGVSFDPALREPVRAPVEQGTGLASALAIGLVLALGALGFALWHADYYRLPLEARPALEKHAWLRPSRGLGLAFAFAACAAIALNLLYLARRGQRFGLVRGALRAWMTSHVASGVLAFLCALLHAAMAPRDTAGGHAFAALAVLLATGAIGRYFYAWVPRAANGRELALEEVRAELERTTRAWPAAQRGPLERLRDEIFERVRAQQWNGGWWGRLRALIVGRRDLRALLERARQAAAEAGLARAALAELERLVERAYRHALAAAHYEDLRALLSSWRYLHRWIAVLMLVLVALHALYALNYSGLLDGGGAP
jgi:thioredoxin reductase/Pyruvate/2-oxoacid:ferredoxin oxidoreductase delta subunit